MKILSNPKIFSNPIKIFNRSRDKLRVKFGLEFRVRFEIIRTKKGILSELQKRYFCGVILSGLANQHPKNLIIAS